MYIQKTIHKYWKYADLTKENGFTPLKSSKFFQERYSVKREVYGKGIKAHNNKKKITKYDWHPTYLCAVSIQLNINQFIENGKKPKAEKIDTFENTQSEELLNKMVDYYLKDDETVDSYSDRFFMNGMTHHAILKKVKQVAKDTKKWVFCSTNSKQIIIFNLSYKKNSLTIFIGYETEKIFDILYNATNEDILNTLKEKAPYVEKIYSSFSIDLISFFKTHLPTVEYILDYAQIPSFIDDLITLKSSSACRKELFSCKEGFEKIYKNYQTYGDIKSEIYKQITVLYRIAVKYPNFKVSPYINNFVHACVENLSKCDKDCGGLPKMYSSYQHIKNIIEIILDGDEKKNVKKFTIERLHFHLYCQFERLLNKSGELKGDSAKIAEIEKHRHGTSDEKITATRIKTELYQNMWEDSKEIYVPSYVEVEDNTDDEYIGTDGTNVNYFIGIILGDIGYSTNPQAYFKYETEHLCPLSVYSNLEVSESNKILISVDSPTLYTPTNYLEGWLERKNYSGTWDIIESWTQVSTDGKGLGFTEQRIVEPNFYYRVRCHHHKGNNTFTTLSDEIYVEIE